MYFLEKINSPSIKEHTKDEKLVWKNNWRFILYLGLKEGALVWCHLLNHDKMMALLR